VAENVLKLEGLILAAAFGQDLACEFVKTAWGVPLGSILLGRRKAFALYGAYVQQLGAYHVLDILEYFHQAFHIVPVHRAHVADVQSFEEVMLIGEQGFQAVTEP